MIKLYLILIISTIIISLPIVSAETNDLIPSWIKTNAEFWVSGVIDDKTFLKGIEYLATNGIIHVAPNEEHTIRALEKDIEKLEKQIDAYEKDNKQLVENDKNIKENMRLLKMMVSDSVPVVEDKGDFYISYGGGSDIFLQTISYEVDFYEVNIKWLNTQYILPYDIQISFQDCGSDATTHHTKRSSYNSELKKIIICANYELEILDEYIRCCEHDHHIDEYFDDVSLLYFYYLVGYALIDAYDIPLTANIDDMAISYLNYYMIEWTEDSWGQKTLYNGVVNYYFLHEPEGLSGKTINESYSLDTRRAIDMACSLYGVNSTFVDLKKYIPADRIDMCESEYKKQAIHWSQVLAPYLNEYDEEI